MNEEKYIKIVLPDPMKTCLSMNGAAVLSPNGEELPNVGKITIHAEGGEFVKVDIECLARIEQINGEG